MISNDDPGDMAPLKAINLPSVESGSAASRWLIAAVEQSMAPRMDAIMDRSVDTLYLCGRQIVDEVQPGLMLSCHDVTYRCSDEFQSQVRSTLSIGLPLAGTPGMVHVKGQAAARPMLGHVVVSGFGDMADCRHAFREGERSRVFGLMLTPPFFERFADAIAGEDLDILSDQITGGFKNRLLQRSSSLIDIGDAMLDHTYSGPLGSLYQESQTLRFLLETALLLREENRLNGQLGHRQYGQVMQAREIIDADLVHPPKTLALAKLVGTNVTSLQRGFREAFGTSIFGYVRGQRLTIARLLIRDAGLGVAEAGFRVGFTNAAAFTAAYRRHFGTPPTSDLTR